MPSTGEAKGVQWTVREIELTADDDHVWWSFPVQAVFTHKESGYGYGAFGLWQFLDLEDPMGETGKQVPGAGPWTEAIAFGGSSYLKPVRETLADRAWWKLEPCRDRLRVDGTSCPLPTAEDLRPPQAALAPGQFVIVYIPRGNAECALEIAGFDGDFSAAKWIDPRTGDVTPIDASFDGQIPARPDPRDEDWVIVVE